MLAFKIIKLCNIRTLNNILKTQTNTLNQVNNSFRLKTVNSKVNNNLVMIPCRSVYCLLFSTNTNRNKHERDKGHGPKDKLTKIQFDSEMVYICVQHQTAKQHQAINAVLLDI